MNILALLFAATITLTAPENGATYEPKTPCTLEFLANPEKRSVRPEEPPLSTDEIKRRDEQNTKYEAWVKAGSDKKTRVKKWERRYNFYERNAWTEELFKRSEKEEQTWKPFAWKADFPVKEVVVEFSETKDFAAVLFERILSDGLRVGHAHYGGRDDSEGDFAMRPNYLKLGTKYFWRVKAKDADGKDVVSDVRSFMTTESLPRMIGAPSFNMRDLGGGKNADGRVVRQGLIFRGQAPQSKVGSRNATSEDMNELYVTKLGIKTELDLRGKDEAAEAESKYNHLQLEKIGINHLFHPIYPYHMMLPDMKPKFAEIIRVFADEKNYPIYFHCAVGSDRTGTIGVLLDGILGRTDEEIYNNYELPTLNKGLPRLRYCRKAAGMFADFDPKTSKFGGKTMRENIVRYLNVIGITNAEIESVRKILLTD